MATETKVLDRATQKQVIIYTGKDLGYLDARELVRDKGGLPSNVLHDDVLVRSDDWKQLRAQNYYGAWAREVLVYPKKNGEFKKGQDVVDEFKDDKGREWVLPASSIPEVAIGRKGVGLFIDPQNIEVNDKRVVVLAEPKSLVILETFIQNSGEVGKVHEATRIPLFVEKDERQYLTDDQKRWLWRIDGAGVRPLVRGCDDVFGDGRGVGALRRHDDGFGVGWVSLSSEQAKPSQAVAQAPNWLITLRKTADLTESSVDRLEETTKPDLLAPVKELIRKVRAIDIKE